MREWLRVSLWSRAAACWVQLTGNIGACQFLDADFVIRFGGMGGLGCFLLSCGAHLDRTSQKHYISIHS